jgi:signal transduction histidine kinase
MLAYSRLSQAEPELIDVDLGAVMTDVCRDFELVIEEKKAVMRIGKLPTVQANQFQMNQVFSNLLSNSLKFSGTGPVIKVTANLVTEDQIPIARGLSGRRPFHQICFADSGIGFEPQYSKKIFELFQRLHSKHRYSGTGIGLSIVKKIIEQHHGYITAEPGEEGGAIFNIWLPAEGLSI